MIAPQAPQMWRELFECALPPDQNIRVQMLQSWRERWCKECHSSYTFSREILEHYKDDKGMVEHAHRDMHFGIADMIFKEKWGLMETEYNSDARHRPDPYRREDRLTIFLLGAP